MKRRRACLIAGSAFFFIATTYGIKEGNVEVGRWTEPDGKNETREIQQDEKEAQEKNSPAGAAAPQSKGSYGWIYDLKGYQSAVAQQKATGKPMVLYFHATWCPYCHAFEKNILGSHKVIQGLSETVKVKIDVEKEEALASYYQIDSFPQFLVVPAKGRAAFLETSVSPDQFLEDAGKAGLKIKERKGR